MADVVKLARYTFLYVLQGPCDGLKRLTFVGAYLVEDLFAEDVGDVSSFGLDILERADLTTDELEVLSRLRPLEAVDTDFESVSDDLGPVAFVKGGEVLANKLEPTEEWSRSTLHLCA